MADHRQPDEETPLLHLPPSGTAGETTNSLLYFRLGALLGAVGVCLGAFGTHELKRNIGDQKMESWNIAVQYHVRLMSHFIHKLARVLTHASAHSLAGADSCTFPHHLSVLLFSRHLYVQRRYLCCGPRTTEAQVDGTDDAGWRDLPDPRMAAPGLSRRAATSLTVVIGGCIALWKF
jgi:uncharacterized membrane protein YgdD (TMEM256/DUF423 family)